MLRDVDQKNSNETLAPLYDRLKSDSQTHLYSSAQVSHDYHML